MLENKITFWASLDTSTRMLEGIATEYAELWNSGEYRAKTGDLVRVGEYVMRLRAAQKAIEETTRNFMDIAPVQSEAVRAPSMPNGFIPAYLASLESRGISTV